MTDAAVLCAVTRAVQLCQHTMRQATQWCEGATVELLQCFDVTQYQLCCAAPDRHPSCSNPATLPCNPRPATHVLPQHSVARELQSYQCPPASQCSL